jgi:hypothetical protein
MSTNRKRTIAIRPAPGKDLRKITKIIGLNGDGFSVLAPYHKARSGFLYKHLMDLRTLGIREVSWEQAVGFTAEDRVKLTYHIDGFAHFSSEGEGKIISGRDPKTGEPKGLGLFTRSLTSPPFTGPSVGIQVWGIEDFEIPRQNEELIIFEPNDFYYRNSTPTEANSWHLAIYAFPVAGIPPVWFEGEQPVMLYQLHGITAGVPGAVIKLKMIYLAAEKLYLGLYIERFAARFPAKSESGWILNGPGSYNQYQSGYVLHAMYPRGAVPVEGRPSLDYQPTQSVDEATKGGTP